jgi:hypothetical protein
MSTPSASRSIRGASVVIRRPAAGPLRDKALALIGIVSLVPGRDRHLALRAAPS